MWGRLLLVGVLLSLFSADLYVVAGGGDGGQKTPNPDGGQKTPNPDGGQKTPNPDGGQKTPNPHGGQKTPNPDGGQKTPNPNGGQKTPRPLESVCQLPQDAGPCNKLEPRWSYNSNSKRCERFLYGGCYGNANNFKEVMDCERHCVFPGVNKPGECPFATQPNDTICGNLCTNDASCPGTWRCCPTSCGRKCQRPEQDTAGYCPLLIRPPSSRDGSLCFKNCTSDQECISWGFLPNKKCCPFEDRKLCMDAVEEHPGVCPRRVEVQTFVPCNNTCSNDQDCSLTEKCCFTGCSRGCMPSVRSDRCQLPLHQGSCSKHSTRYYYDPEKKACISFTYKGCEGNSNNFETMELCNQACGKISQEVCKLPADPGPCMAFSEFYYYNWKTKKCETFGYGACKGNANRFSTKLECQMVCDGLALPVPSGFCQLPPDRKKCSNESSTIRVFYNARAGVCERFVHQGCEGSGNNFATQMECLQACAVPGICQLPSDSGFGDAFRFRYFYNAASGTCETFLYKGSRGNANNFWDKETCVRFCEQKGPRGRCPKANSVGICIMQCESDIGCAKGYLCCPTGCGMACRKPVEEES